MSEDDATAPATTIEELASKLADDLLMLDGELAEVDMIVAQAKAEAARHETRRSAAADKIAALPAEGEHKERLDLTTSLVTLTRRAALMDSQVDVLEGKRRALARYRDAVAAYIGVVSGVDPTSAPPAGLVGVLPAPAGVSPAGEDAPMTAAVSRLVMSAQEDLRREIARAMHDGPAQSLTNIVLQAQIVERLVARDPASASGEVSQLIAMVQQTLDATKSFIFDVRPMVLDDLGLVPTLRRATRERGRRAGIPVEFESLGQDRRLPMDVESSLFRMLDEALAAYLGAGPDRVTLRLDWGDRLEARVAATRAVPESSRKAGTGIPTEEAGKDLPPALAAMLEERRADERDAAEAAVREAIVVLPASTWREIQGRAASVGVTVELLGDGSELRLLADVPALETPAEG
jgi:two-component system sensor histidine kinase DegS